MWWADLFLSAHTHSLNRISVYENTHWHRQRPWPVCVTTHIAVSENCKEEVVLQWWREAQAHWCRLGLMNGRRRFTVTDTGLLISHRRLKCYHGFREWHLLLLPRQQSNLHWRLYLEKYLALINHRHLVNISLTSCNVQSTICTEWTK